MLQPTMQALMRDLAEHAYRRWGPQVILKSMPEEGQMPGS